MFFELLFAIEVPPCLLSPPGPYIDWSLPIVFGNFFVEFGLVPNSRPRRGEAL